MKLRTLPFGVLYAARKHPAAFAALDALTFEKDGVDGKSIYLYGEGWDFGEVAGNGRGRNATQLNIAGTGIGVFNDRLRDAVRGGTGVDILLGGAGADYFRFVNGESNASSVNTTNSAEYFTARFDSVYAFTGCAWLTLNTCSCSGNFGECSDSSTCCGFRRSPSSP